MKVVTWLVSFLANSKFIKMTAVHFQPPTDLLAAVEGRCIDLRSLLDLRSTQYILECNYRLVYLAPVEQFARNWPKEASISTLLFLSGRYYRTLWQHRRPLEGQRRGTRQRRPVDLSRAWPPRPQEDWKVRCQCTQGCLWEQGQFSFLPLSPF